MKRFVSAVMTLMMLLSMLITTSAATIGTIGASFPNEVEQELAVSVGARTDDGEYKSSLTIGNNIYNGVVVDYKATLNMAPIRTLLDNITSIVANDSDAKAEFDAAGITTEVTVTVDYPQTATILDTTAGDLVSYNGIFSKKERIENTAERKLVITYVNKANLTAKELADNKDTYLADLTFVLDDNVKYSTDGHHAVKVTLEGFTQIGFDSKPMTVTYKGGASHIVSAADHMLEVVPVVPATCDEMGWTEGVRCTTHADRDNGYGCGAHGIVKPQQTLPKLDHSIVFVPEVDSTCSKIGVKEHYMCLLCKKDFKDENATIVIDKANLVIPTKEHDHVNIPEIPATCTENGLTAGAVCKNCNHAHDRKIIPATGHTKEPIAAEPATCTTDGWTAGEKCSVCDTILVPRKPVAATGHKFGDWVVKTPATEEAEGLKERECLNGCGTKDTVTIPKLTHEHSVNTNAAVIEKAATCTETGLKQNYCACGEKMGEPEVIPAIGHNATKIDKRDASCTEEGILEHYACANCGGLFTDAECKNKITSARTPVDLENHVTNKVKLPAVAPTCETDGLTEGEKCVACKRVTIPQELVPRLHSLLGKEGDPFEDVEEKAPTCTDEGMHAHKHCKVCDKDYVLDDNNDLTEVTAEDYARPALGHSFKYSEIEVVKEPTETEKGEGVIYCERCDHSKTTEIAIKKHQHNEKCEKIIKPATCTEPGYERIVYTCCGEIKEDNILIPEGHKARKIEKVLSTCYEKGVQEHWYCTVCDQIFYHENCTEATKTTIEKLTMAELQHNFVFHHENDNFIFNKCTYCNDMQKIAKVKDKDTGKDKAKVTDNGNDKAKKDKVKEDSINDDSEDTGRKAYVYPETNLEAVEISSILEKEIHKNDTEVKKASEEKVVVDITVEIVTVYVDKDETKEIHELEQTDILDEDRERLVETQDLKAIEIYIPDTMRGYADYQVHRLHEGVAEVLTTNKNADGEYIIISEDKTKVTIYVKKFSEYAVVGYETKVNPDPVPDPVPTPSYGGGGSSVPTQATIKFNTNGGTVAENIKVGVGEIITPPEVTREGYILEGWYTDYALTIPFDFSQPVKSNVTLYAKWIQLHECRGIHEDNCPCLKFVDLDPTLWYHRGVDYVLNNKMMIGVAKTEFAPDWDITRAMLVTVLWRAEGMPKGKITTFTDLEEGLYYVPAVEWAAQNGIVKGYSDFAFGPNDAITREQFAAIMHRYARSKGFDISAGENANIASYADYNNVSEYAVESMKYAVGSGLIKGRTETTLNPKDATTRAEMATMIYRFYTQIAK